MKRNVKVLPILAAGVLLAQGACFNQALDRTYGRRFHEIFQAQANDRPTLPPTATKGEEERRIIGTYYTIFNPANGGGAAASTQSSFSLPSTSSQQQGSSTLDLRSR